MLGSCLANSLIKKGRIDEAREILVILGDEPNDSPSIVHQIDKAVVYFSFPETESLHLEAIDNIFLDSKHIFQPVSAAKNLRKHAHR
ncbi:hypothetical protein AARAC_007115 [Aspergillus arachidicola]|uniref:Uncharacterized protein n=1 Tax=Aspergillus arachidicola TaxID=656916 RepID=A0A2G7FYN3_9EURO|nr:hypothetical protein AARAC_007115 [Aspergillus arachidicola]